MGIADGELTSIALCWRVERADGAGIGLTSHDQPVESGGVVHAPAPGMIPASITRTLGLEPHSGDIAGALSSDALASGDLALGRWDGASVHLTALDWREADAQGVQLIAGELGEVALEDESFSVELRGAAWKLDEPVCPSTSAECRARFGDQQCRIDLAGRTVRARVVASDGGQLTLDRTVDDAFVLGRLRYLTGANCGLATVILTSADNAVTVRDLPKAPVEPGCRVELREGCDKRFQTCVERFANAINFRGEPHLPGNDLLTRYPGA